MDTQVILKAFISNEGRLCCKKDNNIGLVHKTISIPLICPLCGKAAEADHIPKTIPLIAVHCPNCVKYTVQEDFFGDFNDAEHSFLLSGDICTHKRIWTALCRFGYCNEAIKKQKPLESADHILRYPIRLYNQPYSNNWDGWKEYIDLPDVAYYKGEEELKDLTEKAVKLGYLEVKDGRYKPTVAGMEFSRLVKEKERLAANQKSLYINMNKNVETELRQMFPRNVGFYEMSRDKLYFRADEFFPGFYHRTPALITDLFAFIYGMEYFVAREISHQFFPLADVFPFAQVRASFRILESQ